MTKKQYLELLIKSYGLRPQNVEHYKTESCDGAYEVKTGWRGYGMGDKGEHVISFYEPDGFQMAVYKILQQAEKYGLKPVFIDN